MSDPAPVPAPLIDRAALDASPARRRERRQSVPRSAEDGERPARRAVSPQRGHRDARGGARARRRRGDPRVLARSSRQARSTRQTSSPSAATAAASCIRNPTSICSILLENASNKTDDAIGRFLTFLWDIGLEVGHSVRTLDDCETQARGDVTVLTTLMETRLLHGRGALFGELPARIGTDRMWNSAEFFRAKLEEQRARHARYHDTAYNLEPNVKGSPGGLRDIQMIGWLAQRHLGTRTLADLVPHKFLTDGQLANSHDRPRVSLANPLRPASADGPPRGSPAVRPSGEARADARLRGRELHARRRATDAALLPHGDGAQPPERDAAAALRGSDSARQERAAAAAWRRASRAATAISKSPTIKFSPATRRPCSRCSCCSSRTSTCAASTRARLRSSSSICGSSTRSFARTRATIACSSTSCAHRKA